jgi:Uma2 family endonuclease
VSVRDYEPLQRVPMSRDEYLALPEWPRAEWVDGEAVLMNVPPGVDHGDANVELTFLVKSLFRDHYVLAECYLDLPRNRVRLPDLMVAAAKPAGQHVTEPPLMVAEVLSRSTRTEDTVRKSVEYAEMGIGQYWLLDPVLRTIEVLRNDDGTWTTLLLLDDDQPEGSVELDGVTIPLDLRRLLRA